MTDKTIFRTEKNAGNPFVMIDRRPIENQNLSWKAKGILTYLLSRPDNWTVRLGDLANRSTDGVTAIRAALKELTKAGHLTRREEREGGRFKQYVLIVHEVPVRTPHAGKPHAEKPQAENLTLNNTDINDMRDNVAQKLAELQGGGLRPTDADLLKEWADKHTEEWILKAIAVAKNAGARSSAYVDKVLIGWEANGYPKPREQKVKEAKANGNKAANPPAVPEYTDADRLIAAQILADRAAAM